MSEPKLIVPEMRKQLPDADLATIEQFQARMLVLLGQAQDVPTRSEFEAFDAVLATAHANVLAGKEAVPPVEERLTAAEWAAKMEKEAVQPPVDTTLVEEPEPAEPPAETPEPEKKNPGKRPFDRKRKPT